MMENVELLEQNLDPPRRMFTIQGSSSVSSSSSPSSYSSSVSAFRKQLDHSLRGGVKYPIIATLRHLKKKRRLIRNGEKSFGVSRLGSRISSFCKRMQFSRDGYSHGSHGNGCIPHEELRNYLQHDLSLIMGILLASLDQRLSILAY
jgi:hypothetical protein